MSSCRLSYLDGGPISEHVMLVKQERQLPGSLGLLTCAKGHVNSVSVVDASRLRHAVTHEMCEPFGCSSVELNMWFGRDVLVDAVLWVNSLA